MQSPLLSLHPKLCDLLLRGRKLALVVGLLLVASPGAWAQSAANYNFATTTTGSLMDMSSGTTALLPTGAYLSSGASNVTDIGFDVGFMGSRYIQFSANVHGQLRLGSTPISTSGITSGSAGAAILAPITSSNAILATGKVHYKITGTAPNRALVVEWQDMRIPASTAAGTGSLVQALIRETSGVIEYRYGSMFNNATSATSRSVGFSSGPTAGLLGVVTSIPTTLAYNNAATTYTTSSFVANSAMINLNGTADGSRRTFTFTPSVAPSAAPTNLTFSALRQTGLTLNWADNATNELGYSIYRSTDNVTFSFAGQTAANATSFTDNGLSAVTTYYYEVRAFTEALQSAAATGSQATLAATPLNGTYTIDRNGSGARNFTSFTAAITALNEQGIDASVVFSVSNGQVFAETPPVITATGTGTPGNPATPGNTITFREAALTPNDLTDNPTLQPTGGTGTADAGIIISGGNFITFDGINVVTGAGTSDVEYGYLVRNLASTNSQNITTTDGAQNIIVRNARIALNRSNTASVGLFQTADPIGGGTLASTSNPATSTNRFNQYHNLTIENVYRGIYLLTGNTGAAAYDDNNQVYNNTIGSASAGDIGGSTVSTSGIQAVRQNNLRVYNNEVRNVSGTSTVHGILIDDSFGTSSVYNNRIHDIQNTSASSISILYGILASTSDDTGAQAHSLSIYNNFVYELLHAYTGTAHTTRRVVGIEIGSGGDANGSRTNIYYNSVRIQTPAAYTSSSTAFESGASTTGTILTLRNNIFTNFSTAPAAATTARHTAIYSSSATAFGNAGSTSDFNNLYAPNGLVGRGSSTDFATLTNWQDAYPNYGANGQKIDFASFSADPFFASATDLHASSLVLNNVGTPIAGITTDIDGETRSNTPDIGADEFTPAADDASVTAITAPTMPFAPGAQPISATVTNVGISVLTSVTLTYTLNGGQQTTQTFSGLSLAAGGNTTLTFSTPATFAPNASAVVVVTSSQPNGNPDANPSNDSFTETVFPALQGAYTIDNQQPTGGRNFVSFADAVTALGAGGVVGPGNVTFGVANGPYNEQVVLTSILGASSSVRVEFNGVGAGRTLAFASTNTAARAVLRLNGADFVTFNNLTIDATGGTFGWGVHLNGGADNNQILNSIIRTDAVSTSSTNFFGILSTSSTSDPTAAGDAANNLVVRGNTITGGYHSISLYGSTSVSVRNTGNLIDDNDIQNFYADGIYLYGQGSVQVIGNDISRPARTNSTTAYGIEVGGSSTDVDILRNRIHDLFPAILTPTSTAYGIDISSSDGGAGALANNVENNAIYNFTTSGAQYGLHNSGSNNTLYYHNTVALDHTASTSSSATYGFYQTTAATGIELKNNIISVTRGGSGSKYAIFLNGTATAASSTIASDYNDLYVPLTTATPPAAVATYFTGHLGSSTSGLDYGTLANWQAATPYDDNSVQLEPLFNAPATGDLKPTASVLDDKGTPLGITTDLLGLARSTTAPDLGAVEFTAPPDDAAVVSIDSPVAPYLAGSSQPVTATVRNNGLVTLNTVTLTYVLNAGASVAQTFGNTTPLALAPGQTVQLTFTTQVVIPAGAGTLTVTSSLPNGNADGNASNNTATLALYPGLNGPYTIDKTQPTAGTNFASFADAATALNVGGVLGTVTMSVLNGPYTEQLLLREVPGTSASRTITFTGNAQTLQFGSADGSSRAVVALNGTDYVTISDLRIDATNGGTPGTFGWGVHLTSGADNNQILNSTITSSTTSPSTNFAGIVASGSPTSATTGGNAANSLTLQGNTIVGGYYGIILNGTNSSTLATNNVVRNNEVRDFYSFGIDIDSNDGPQIVGNNVHRSTRATGLSTFYGIYLLDGTRGAVIERNRVHSPFTGNPASTNDAYGIYFTNADGAAGQENRVVNNLIYGFNGAGDEYGIYNSNSDHSRYYFNSVSLDNLAGTGSEQETYGFYQTNTASNIDFRNNVLSVTRVGGTSGKYALYFASTSSAITSNYNNLYIGQGTAYFTGRFNSAATGVDYRTLAEWKSGQNQDASSVQGNPGFTSATDLTPNPADPNSWHLNGTGVQLTAVPTDFAGAARPITVAAGAPDLGAYQFTPTATPNNLVATGNYAPGATQDFFFGGRRMASITYGATGTLPTTLSVKYYPGTNPRGPVASARYLNSFLELTGSSDGAGFEYALTLHYDEALLGTVTPEAALRLSRRDPATGIFTFFDSATLDAAANTLTQAGLTAFGEFTGSDQLAPLPVSLVSFEAKRQGADAVLSWTTAQEQHSRGFEVQVSVDGRAYRPLGFVASPTPNAATARTYRFLDQEAGKQGTRHYRLRQLDLDGTQAFFGPRTLAFEAATTLAATAWPSPFAGQLTVEVVSPAAGAAELVLLDALGRAVLRQPAQLVAGVQQVPLGRLEHLPTGAYLLRLTAGGQTRTLRLVKQ